MAENSEISWTHHTANFWWGCVKVSPLCDHCYAETWTKRVGGDFTNDRRFIKSIWKDIPKWQAQARSTGERKRIFVMSMGDIFEELPIGHKDRDQMNRVRQDAFTLMEACPDLDFLLLTKRISNVAKMVPQMWLEEDPFDLSDRSYWPRHIRLGISVGTQKDADRDIPRLLAIKCPNFLSMEPLLEKVDLLQAVNKLDWLSPASLRPGGIDWVITGGESGSHARPSHPDWFRSLRDQCAAANVPFHFKQWGEWRAQEDVGRSDGQGHFCHHTQSFKGPGEGVAYIKVGKKAAGHLLDSTEHYAFPSTT